MKNCDNCDLRVVSNSIVCELVNCSQTNAKWLDVVAAKRRSGGRWGKGDDQLQGFVLVARC